MVSDGLVLGVCTVLAALITAVGTILGIMLQRNHRQGTQIHHMVNGELARERRKNQFYRQQLAVLKELGIAPGAVFDDPADIQTERRKPDL